MYKIPSDTLNVNCVFGKYVGVKGVLAFKVKGYLIKIFFAFFEFGYNVAVSIEPSVGKICIAATAVATVAMGIFTREVFQPKGGRLGNSAQRRAVDADGSADIFIAYNSVVGIVIAISKCNANAIGLYYCVDLLTPCYVGYVD